MKIIITGGTGFIGSTLINALLASGNKSGAPEIIVPSRSPERVKTPHPSVRVVKWDAQTAAGWGEHVDGADAVINLAGEPIAPTPWFGDRKAKISASRVNAGRAIVEAISQAQNKPRVLVQSSAVGYYGIHGDLVRTENSPPGSDFLASVCVDWENSTAAVEAMGVRRPIYRTGIVLSRAGGVLPLMSMPFQFFVGGRLGSGKQWISWIHAMDEVAAILLLLSNDSARGAYNLTAPNPVTNAEFSNALAKAMGRPALVPVPAFAMKLPFGEMADLMLLHGQRVVPERLAPLGFQFQYPTITAALNNLYAR